MLLAEITGGVVVALLVFVVSMTVLNWEESAFLFMFYGDNTPPGWIFVILMGIIEGIIIRAMCSRRVPRIGITVGVLTAILVFLGFMTMFNWGESALLFMVYNVPPGWMFVILIGLIEGIIVGIICGKGGVRA
jgi:hypothetical protein